MRQGCPASVTNIQQYLSAALAIKGRGVLSPDVAKRPRQRDAIFRYRTPQQRPKSTGGPPAESVVTVYPPLSHGPSAVGTGPLNFLHGSILPGDAQFRQDGLLPGTHLLFLGAFVQVVVAQKVQHGMSHQVRQLPAL